MSSLLRPHFVLLMLVVFASSAFAASKIRGKIKDKQSGEPLIGASIVIEGTTQGASADINGDYIILNVQPGKYTLRASYLGYQSVTISNVTINIDMTTDVNFELSSEAVSLQTVQIVAEAPLVNKNATNTVVQFKSDQIENIPVRGIQGVFALAGGIVSQGGNLYVRGGRTGEVAFYVDGVLVNNPMNRQSALTVINNAIEEVSAQIGGMTAEYGNALSGVVNTSTKIGTPQYKMSVEVITDGFLSNTNKILNTYSYGLNDYSMTASGPVIPGNDKIRFFLAGSRTFDRSTTTYLDGFKYPVTFDSLDITNADFTVTNRDSGIVKGLGDGTTGRRASIVDYLNATDLKGGRNFGGLSNDAWTLNGNVYFDLKEFNVKVGGTYSTAQNYQSIGKGYGTYRITTGTYRPGKTETEDYSGYLKFTHVLDPKTFYTVNASVFSFFQEQGDALLFRNYESYGDPNNPVNSYLAGPSREPNNFSIFGVSVASPGFMSQKNYSKISRQSMSGRFDFVRQMNNAWEFKVGAELQRYTLRTFNIAAFSLAKARFDNPTSSDWLIYSKANATFYGYDIYGKEFEGGSFTDKKTGLNIQLPNEGPRNPMMLGTYVQNKFEMSDLILNIGFRFDYLDPGTKRYKNGNNIALTQIDGVPILSDSTLVDQDITMQISPRIGFSFPVTDKTVFHAEYGKFIAQGGLNDLYDATTSAGRFLAGGLARQFPNPNLKPERTTDYQIGFRQQVGDVSAFDLSFFYKETKDLIVIRQIYPEPGATHPPYIGNVNGDFGTVRGLTIRYDIRRIERVALNASYTLQSALATGSASATHFNIAWQDVSGPDGVPYFPIIPAPTDFDRSHFGNINLDYRFAQNDGPMLFDTKILERAGANMLFNFSSGRRYTKNQVSSAFFPTNAPVPYETINASSAPWTFQLDLRVNKMFTLVRGVDMDVYVWVVNLLNTKNIVNIYSATGLPDNDGFFSTEAGTSYAAQRGADAKKVYDYVVDNAANYGTPRIIRLGARLTF